MIPDLGPLRSEHLEAGDRRWEEGRFDAALRAYTAELERDDSDHFTRGMAHKRIVSVLAEAHGADAVLDHYRMARRDDHDLTIGPDEIICCATVHDEADRLPFFLRYYERLGVDRFFMIDNDSSDATRQLLLERPNVHVWSSDMRYWRANYGMAWIDAVLNLYGRGHWCVIVDCDEFLYYPRIEERRLPELCDALDRDGKVAMPAVLLDMYSEGPIREAVCAPGTDPAEVCPCFDRDFSHRSTRNATPWANIDAFWGGVRRRVFGEDSDVFLTKVPLVRYDDDTLVLAGTHGTNAPQKGVASERGALLHYKLTSRFVERLEQEIATRSEWDAQGESYSEYARIIAEQPNLTCYDAAHSVTLRDSRQLLDLGVMAVDLQPALDEYVRIMHDVVPGWFGEVDAALFRAVDAAQREIGVTGDILEIGVFYGKSATLLGFLLRGDEELVAWDLFSGEQLAGEADAPFYQELTQVAFEENYRRFHERPPTAIARSSLEIPDAGLGRRFRIVHVDGSHRYEIVRHDISSALDLVLDGGVIVIDDYRTLPHALGVAAAVWDAVTAGRLVPLLASDQKLYTCATGRAGGVVEPLRSLASERAGVPAVRQDVAGHEVAVFTTAAMTTGEPVVANGSNDSADGAQGAAVEEAAALRAELAEVRTRLDLIEGSRTWRLRTKFARFLPTRR